MKRAFTMATVVLAMLNMLSLPHALAAESDVPWPKTLVISVPSSGNVTHLLVSAMGKTLERHTPIKRVVVQPLGGPLTWVPKMEKGQVQLAVHSGPDTVLLLQGKGMWAEKPGSKPFLRTVITGNSNHCGVFTLPSKNIKSYADLKNKAVIVHARGSTLWDMVSEAILGSVGLKISDLKADLTNINYGESSREMIEGRVDAAIFAASGSFMLELEQAEGANVVISPTPEQADYVLKHLPRGFFVTSLPAHAPFYNNSSALERTFMFRNAMYCSVDMDPRLTYSILKTLDENRDEWESISPIAEEWGTPYDYAPPYHEGVIRYYKEKGLWKGEIVENQKLLLESIGAEK